MAVLVISLIILSLAALYFFVFLFPGNKRGREIPKNLLVNYAHRGLHTKEIPENSLAAFRNAVDHGHGMELDVQLSRDGEVMVFHDYTLIRMTGDERKLSELTATELRELTLNGTDEKIPYLKEVLELVDGKVPLLIELKGESTDTSLCPKVCEILDKYEGAYLIESFNPMLLAWLKKNRKNVLRGILTTKSSRERGLSILNFLLDSMMLNVLSRPDFVAYDRRYNKFSVSACKRLFSLPGFIWTVRGREELEGLAKEDNIIFEGFLADK